jgi:hypothetical protein
MACDICGKKGVRLEEIREIYKTADVQDICDECMGIINKQLSKIRSSCVNAQTSLLKQFMMVFKMGKQ